MEKIKSLDKIQKSFSIDASLEELTTEAKMLFDLLSLYGEKIAQLESTLKNLTANFPFRLKISEDKESHPKQPEDHHKSSTYNIVSYYTQVHWYLSWEASDNDPKNYRLFLIADEKEIVDYPVFHNDEESTASVEFQSKCIFKKAFSETDLPTRLRYFEHIIHFIDSFKDYLKKYRVSIDIIEQLSSMRKNKPSL